LRSILIKGKQLPDTFATANHSHVAECRISVSGFLSTRGTDEIFNSAYFLDSKAFDAARSAVFILQ
jgi:hypothetical protein